MPASPSAFHRYMIVRTHLAVYPSNSATSRGVLPSFACHKLCQWVRSTASVVCRYRFWSSSAVKSVCTSTLFAIPLFYTTCTDFILQVGRQTMSFNASLPTYRNMFIAAVFSQQEITTRSDSLV